MQPEQNVQTEQNDLDLINQMEERNNFQFKLSIISYIAVHYVLSIPLAFFVIFLVMISRPGLEESIIQIIGSLYLTFIVGIVLTIITVIFLWKIIIADIRRLKKNLNWLLYIGIAVIGFIALIATSMILDAIYNAANLPINPDNQQAINSMAIYGNIPVLIISVVFLAPIYEELIFRKCFFGLIKNKWIGLVVSSLVFGLIHVISTLDWVSLPIYVIPGFIFGLVYIFSKKNIYSTWLLHTMNNAFSIICLLLSTYFM